MSTLTLTSPGVQINEVDLSLISRPVGTTDVLITGFTPQGPTEHIVNVTSVSDFEQTFGTPTNSAERYLYYTAKQILLNSPANLLVSRMPYGSGAGEGYASYYSVLAYPIVVPDGQKSINGVTSVTLSVSGAGYDTAPTVIFGNAGQQTAAIAIANLSDSNNQTLSGQVSSISIIDAGYGYTGTPTVTLSGGGFSVQAEASATTSVIATIDGKFANANYYNLGQPTSLLITDDEYNKLLTNDVVWNETWNSLNDNSINSFADIGKAGLIVINNAKTSVNNLYEGFYVGIADNSSFNPSSDFNSITGIKAVVENNGFTQNFSTPIPAPRLNFTLQQPASAFGKDSVSKVIENYPTGFDFGARSFDDSLVLVFFNVKTTQYGQDTVILDYSVAEGYSGSLYSKRTQNNPYGGTPISYFIDTVVNSKSTNFKVVTNPYISDTGTWVTTDGTTGVAVPAKTIRVSQEAKNLYSSGVYASDTDKNSVEVGNVPLKLQRVLTKLENNDTINIDVVAEAGLGTIWAGAKVRSQDAHYTSNPIIFDEFYNVDLGDLYNNDGTPVNGTTYQAYTDVLNQFVAFADQSRRDHVFVADPLRHIFVQGQNAKITTKKTYNFSDDIYWPLRNLFGGVQSSYVATYGNWIKTNDVYTNKEVWVPSSGYAAAVLATTSQQAFPWIAPAGFNRGTLTNVTDLAINPTQKQRDLLYKININPIAFFPNDGYVVFGQKTLFRKPSAFDRLNVRRLFLTLEKQTQTLLKYFVFEQNSFATRSRLKAALLPTFDQAKLNDGLYDYLLVCDETNNTPDVIDNNELKIAIYIQPVRSAEFILADFIATRTGVNFSELVG